MQYAIQFNIVQYCAMKKQQTLLIVFAMTSSLSSSLVFLNLLVAAASQVTGDIWRSSRHDIDDIDDIHSSFT